MNRVVLPEILDHLDPADPAALRSRSDLRRIHLLMGNSRWLHSAIPKDARSILEIGAGEGCLVRSLSKQIPTARVTGVDLIPGPPDLNWQQGDLFCILADTSDEVLVGMMILHHFSDEQLRQLGSLLGNFQSLFFCEPWRSPVSLYLGAAMSPFFNSVTRHDLPTSVKAGFRQGELPGLLGLNERDWQLTESIDWRGALRLRAIRK